MDGQTDRIAISILRVSVLTRDNKIEYTYNTDSSFDYTVTLVIIILKIYSFPRHPLSCMVCQCGLAVRGRVGAATLASGVLFVARRGACVRVRADSGQSNVISRRRRTCLNLSVSTCFS